MAYSKTTWVNGQTPINDTNLNKIENELEALDNGKQNTLTAGTNITIENNVISASGGSAQTDYTTTETVVGTFLGKPLYQKTIVLENTTISSSTKEMVILDITNYDVVLVTDYYINADLSSASGNRHKFVENVNDNNNNYVNIRGWQNSLLIQTNWAYYIYKGYITVRYTKTTD